MTNIVYALLSKYRILRNTIATKYFSHWLILFIDLIVSVTVSLTVCLIIKSITQIAFSLHAIEYISLLAIPASLLAFWCVKTTRNIIRYSNLRDIWRLFVASIIKAIIIYSIVYLTGWITDKFLIKVLICADIFTTLFALVLARILMVLFYDIIIIRASTIKSNMLIYGIGKESVSIITRLKNHKTYNVVGFVCRDQSVSKYKLAGHNIFVVKSSNDLRRIAEKYNIKNLLFTNYNSLQKENNDIVSYCIHHNIKVLVAPSVNEVGQEKNTSIRNVKIEDLLSRDEIIINLEKIRESVQGRVVLVTGAAGSIGSELCRQLSSLGVKELILLDNAETPLHNFRLELRAKNPNLNFIPIVGDVRQKTRLNYIFETYKPYIVFHAAAYKHVPLMEENPCEAALVNVIGTSCVADMCIKHNVYKMVMISTDKAVNPTNVMGASKRMAEIYVQSLGMAVSKGIVEGITKFTTTRFGNVLGSNGSVIPLFRKQIQEGGPVTVTHPDITRFFMTIPEACRLVLEAASMCNGNDIFVFDMGESVKISDMAKKMIVLSGFIPDKDIKIKYTGLRVGEKLYEEVLSNKENTIPTNNKKIMIAKVREYDYHEALQMVKTLNSFATEMKVYDTVKYMKETVPEFISNNSIYVNIDHEIANIRK